MRTAMGDRQHDDPQAAAGGQSWVDRHRPSRSADLPVHHSKVKAVREWLNRCVVNGRRDGHAPPSILALCGMSGCCKSSLVELLCREMTVQVHEWSDDCWEGDAIGIRNHSLSTDASSGSSRDLFTLVGVTKNAWTNKAEVMQDFSRRCQYPSLECVHQASSSRRGYPPGTRTGFLDGSSSRTAASKGYQLSRSSSNSSNNTIRYLSTALGSTDDSSIEDCSSDEDTSAACYPSGLRVAPPSSRSAGTLILLHDPLSHYSQQRTGAPEHFEAVHRFLLSSPCPVVLVVSEVDARDEHCVDQYVPASIRKRVDFHSIYFPPITDIKMTKVLRTIVSSELGGHTCDVAAISQAVRSVAESSQGDVRHAIVQLQLVLSTAAAPLQRLPASLSLSLGSKAGTVGKGTSDGAALSQGDIFPRRKRHKPASLCLPPHNSLEGMSSAIAVAGIADLPPIGANTGSTIASDRDSCYSSMHCVGRLLHAKLDRCGAVSFDPDSAAACSELSLSALSDLLQWNAAGCLMDERRIDLDCETPKGDSNSALRELTSLEGLHGIFSDEDLLAARKYDPVGGGDECFSEVYSRAILSRATAVVRGIGSRERAEQVKLLGLSNSFMPIRGSQASRLRSRMLHLRHNLRAVQEQLFEWLSTSPGTPLSGCSPTGHLSLRELTLCVLPLQRHITTVLGPSADELPPDLSRLMIGIYDCREQDSYRCSTAQLSVDHSAEEQVLVDSILE